MKKLQWNPHFCFRTCELRQGDFWSLRVAVYRGDGDCVGGMWAQVLDAVKEDAVVQVTRLGAADTCQRTSA